MRLTPHEPLEEPVRDSRLRRPGPPSGRFPFSSQDCSAVRSRHSVGDGEFGASVRPSDSKDSHTGAAKNVIQGSHPACRSMGDQRPIWGGLIRCDEDFAARI